MKSRNQDKIKKKDNNDISELLNNQADQCIELVNTYIDQIDITNLKEPFYTIIDPPSYIEINNNDIYNSPSPVSPIMNLENYANVNYQIVKPLFGYFAEKVITAVDLIQNNLVTMIRTIIEQVSKEYDSKYIVGTKCSVSNLLFLNYLNETYPHTYKEPQHSDLSYILIPYDFVELPEECPELFVHTIASTIYNTLVYSHEPISYNAVMSACDYMYATIPTYYRELRKEAIAIVNFIDNMK